MRSFPRTAILIVLLAAFMQVYALAQDVRFHPDEAYFMTFARNAAVNGDWLLSGALDKPPLTMYLNAVALMLFAVQPDSNGVLQLDIHMGEFAGRVPSVMCALLTVALVMRIAYCLWRAPRLAYIAGVLMAVSPFMVAYGATAFTDMPMVCFGLAAWYMMLRQRPHWAGVLWALSFAAKPQAIFLLPLIVMVPHMRISMTWQFTYTAAIALAPLLLWDAARPEASVFVQGATNNLSHKALFATDVIRRLGLWGQFVQWVWLPAITAIASLMLVWRRVWHHPIGLRLLLWGLAYSAFHIVFDVNIYDRYVLLLLPVFALHLAWAVHQLPHVMTQYAIVSIVVLMCVLYSLRTPLQQIPMGGDKGQHAHIDELAEYLNNKPVATVVYDPWLGWELGYYMGQWSNKRRVHYPTPQALAQGATMLDEAGIRYLLIPAWVHGEPWLQALQQRGFAMTTEHIIGQVTVVAISPPS